MEKSLPIINNSVWRFYKFYIFLAMLASFKAWFFGGLETKYLGILSLFVSSLVYFIIPQAFGKTIEKRWFLLLLLCFVFGFIIFGPFAVIGQCLNVLSLAFVLLLKPLFRKDLLITIRFYLAILLAVSVVGWILKIIGISTPYTMIELGELEDGRAQYIYENHYIYLVNVTRFDDILPRFCSVFIEPGYLGCLMALYLYISNYKMDKVNVIFCISLFLTLSLAGYILFVLGFVFSMRNKMRSYYFLGISVFLLAFFVSIQNVDILNIAISQRLEFRDGSISGYNRSHEYDNAWFWNKFISSDQLWLGTRTAPISDNNVDWKYYIVSHGLISFMFFVLFLMYPTLTGNKRKECMYLSLIYFLIFSQTIYMAHSLMYMILYVLGISNFKTQRLNSCFFAK